MGRTIQGALLGAINVSLLMVVLSLLKANGDVLNVAPGPNELVVSLLLVGLTAALRP